MSFQEPFIHTFKLNYWLGDVFHIADDKPRLIRFVERLKDIPGYVRHEVYTKYGDMAVFVYYAGLDFLIVNWFVNLAWRGDTWPVEQFPGWLLEKINQLAEQEKENSITDPSKVSV